jgi:2-oxo-4-hydroxy-4-carboxy--5-ureidoimidazoline (OHCU) decarboxylase
MPKSDKNGLVCDGKNEKEIDPIDKRVLEAEKVVVSNMLHNWRKRYGMDYILIVRNSPDEVFARFRISDSNKTQMRDAVEELVRMFWGTVGLTRLHEFEKEMGEMEDPGK